MAVDGRQRPEDYARAIARARADAIGDCRRGLLAWPGGRRGARGAEGRRAAALAQLDRLDDLESHDQGALQDAIWRTVGYVLLAAGQERLWGLLYGLTDGGCVEDYAPGDEYAFLGLPGPSTGTGYRPTSAAPPRPAARAHHSRSSPPSVSRGRPPVEVIQTSAASWATRNACSLSELAPPWPCSSA